MRRGGVLPPTPVLAPGSALGSRPRVALSSAQVFSVYRGALGSGKGLLLGPGWTPGLCGSGSLRRLSVEAVDSAPAAEPVLGLLPSRARSSRFLGGSSGPGATGSG